MKTRSDPSFTDYKNNMAGSNSIAIFTNEGVLLNTYIEELADVLAERGIEGAVKTTILLSGGSAIEIEVRAKLKKRVEDRPIYTAWSCERGGRGHFTIHHATQKMVDEHIKNCREPINEKGKED